MDPARDIPRALEACGYRVARELGRGGMGVVYLAHQLSLGRDVAIKVILPGGPDDHLKRFRGEAATLKAIRHPNVVRLLDVSLDATPPFIVFEYVEGGRTLTDVLADNLTLPERLLLARSVLEGLSALREHIPRHVQPARGTRQRPCNPRLLMCSCT